MAIINASGIATESAENTLVTASQSIIAALGDNAGARSFDIQSSTAASRFEVSSHGDTTVKLGDTGGARSFDVQDSGATSILNVASDGDVVAKLGDTAGATSLDVQDSAAASLLKVESDGDVTVENHLIVNGRMEGFKTDINQTSHGFTLPTHGVRPIVHNTGTGLWELAKADVETTAADTAIIKIIDTNNFRISSRGFITVASHGLDVGYYYVLSDATAGAVVREDLFGGSNKQRIIRVIDSDTLEVLVDPMIVP